MPFHSLQSFISFLEEKGDLLRIKVEVDPVLEISEIAIRTVQKDGPALLFENVTGSTFPLLINVLGSARRIEWALGRKPAAVGEELKHFAESLMPPSPSAILKNFPTVKRILAMGPKNKASGPVKKNRIEPADLGKLPIAQSWPGDGGKFITFPLVLTRSPNDGKSNVGVYRMHVYNGHETGMHWQIAKGGGFHYQQAEAKGQALPVAVVLGADPILMMCGILPLPENLSEIAFAGFLRGEGTRMTEFGSISAPAEAEFILEGSVPPNERRREGPYGDHFGHYSLAADFPIFKIDRIWHRDGAVFPIAIVGKPPQEDQVIGDAVQEMLLPLLKVMHPEIIDLWAYMEAGFHNLLAISVKQRFAKEAVKTGLWALGEGQLSLTKVVVLVDPDVNARKFTDVLRAIRANFDPADDFLLLPGTSMDTLDFTSGQMNLGSKMIIDATGGGRKPGHLTGGKVDIEAIRRLDPRIKDVRVLEDALLAVQVEGNGREILEKMINLPSMPAVSLVAAVSPDVPLDDRVLLPWGIFTRFDCARDTFFHSVELKGGHPVYRGPLYIDATMKPGYPEPLVMTDEIIQRVDRRWNEYGFR